VSVLHVHSGTISQSYSYGDLTFGRVVITGGANVGAIRTIMANTGDLITFPNDLPSSDLSGLTLSIRPGCKKRYTEDCTSKFNNASNFFGFPWAPDEGSSF
jgi:hypothetical protein